MIYIEGMYSDYTVVLDVVNDKHVCNVVLKLGKLYNDSQLWKNLEVKITTEGDNDLDAYQKALDVTGELYNKEIKVIDDIDDEFVNSIKSLARDGVDVKVKLYTKPMELPE